MSINAQLIAAVTAAALVLAGYPAHAQSREDWRATEKRDGAPLNLEESYAGVTPGTGNNLPRVAELKGKPGIWVTWPGFMMREDGGSRLFIQTTVPIQHTVKASKSRHVISLKGAKVFLSNNRNPLVTTHFNTPLNRAYLKRRGKDTELVLELRSEQTPSIHQSTDADGYHYLFIDFAPGDYPLQLDGASGRPSFSGYGTRKKGQPEPTESTEP